MEKTYELKFTIYIDPDYKIKNPEMHTEGFTLGDKQPDGKYMTISASAGGARIEDGKRTTVFIEKPYGSNKESLHRLLDFAMEHILLDVKLGGEVDFVDLRGVVTGALKVLDKPIKEE